MTESHVLHPAILWLALGCGVMGVITDLRSRRIPNLLTGPAMLLGLILHFAAGGWTECGSSLLALVLCGAVFLVFQLAGGMGGGDVKLIAAEACLLGLSSAGSLLLYTVLCGGLMGLLLAIKQGQIRQTLQNVLVLTSHHSRNGLQPHPQLNVLNASTLRLPYALAIAAGCVLTVLPSLYKGAGL
ncbi:MAG: A24 family peptidase [Janthinobacterium lividum]